MKKLYIIKFYSQVNGSTKLVEHDLIEKYEHDKKQAFKTGRGILSKFAKDFINNYDGDNNDSRIVDAIENYASLINNATNSYSEDARTWLFKVFSKKIKK